MADAERVVQITYKIEGAEEAAEAQDRIGESAGSAGRKLEGQIDIARASEQVYQRQQQSLNDLNEAFSGLSSTLGSESELGSFLGRMSHSAQVGRQLGSALGGISPQLGPLASVLGTLTGAAIPAINALFDALTPTVPALIDVTEETRRTSEAVIEMGDSFANAGERMRDFLDSISTAGRARALQDTNAQITELADNIARIEQTGSAGERLGLIAMRERMASMVFEAEQERQQLESEGAFSGGGGRRGGRRGQRPDRQAAFRSDRGEAIRELMEQESLTARFERQGQDAFEFARGLGTDPLEAIRKEEEARDRLKEKQRQAHEEQMQRVEEEVAAWTAAGEKIGSSIYNAFQVAASGQEDYDVALVKSFKGLAIQFGGQMVNEGIGALLTAIGSIATPPIAAAKAAEGAGKLALGIGLGAAGAAIPVPASSGGQSNVPKLGPSQQDSGASGGSVIVNMNSPAIVTGTRAELGRELGATLRDARQRFGGRMSA